MTHTILYECICGAEGVTLSRWELDPPDSEICVSFFSAGHDGDKYDWKHRLQHIWHIVTKGHPYLDNVILDLPTAHALGEKLLELSAKGKL